MLVVNALAPAVDRQAQTPADLLPLLVLGSGFVESADLKHVGIIPAFPQGGVREDETQRFVGIEQALLLAHDEAVGILIIPGVAACVLIVTLLVLAEVTIMNLGNIERD